MPSVADLALAAGTKLGGYEKERGEVLGQRWSRLSPGLSAGYVLAVVMIAYCWMRGLLGGAVRRVLKGSGRAVESLELEIEVEVVLPRGVEVVLRIRFD